MTHRLPSLTALRTFEAAARHLSFAKAAQELFVTPAAVGFQIKQLEDELGGRLFLRKHRAIELTSKGSALLTDLGPVFRTIEDAWNAAHEPTPSHMLKVSEPARAIHSWVLPAINQAPDKPQGLRIAWDLSKQNRDISSGEVDIAIRWAREPNSDLHWAPLLRTWFTPLMRPDVARFVERPSDLARHDLIDVEFVLDAGGGDTSWAAWHRVNDLLPPKDFAVTCSDTASAVETALATESVAIAGSFLAQTHLNKGELVAPFDTAIAPFSQFWLVCRKGLETTPEYLWFLETIRQSAKLVDAAAQGFKLYYSDGNVVPT